MTFRVVITARPMFAHGSSRMELVIDYHRPGPSSRPTEREQPNSRAEFALK